jgi:streptogramin lyase
MHSARLRRGLVAATTIAVASLWGAPAVDAADPLGQITPAATGGVTPGFPADTRPDGMAVGSDGNVWFTIPFAGIGRLNPDGSVSVFTAGITSDSVRQITPGPDGNLWFTEFNSPQHIGKVTTAGVITEVATSGVTPGLPNGNIEDITTGPDGNVWFSMPFISPGTQGAIGKINPADNSVTVYTATYDTTTTPRGVTGGPDGNVWFTDDAAGVIGKIAPDGTITVVATSGTTPGFTGVNPFTLTTGSDGNLWVNLTGAVARVTTAGVVTEFPLANGGYEYDITSACDGALWITQNPDGEAPAAIFRVTTSGVVTPYTQGLQSGSVPSGITAVPNGDVYFADSVDPGFIMRVGTGCAAPPVPVAPNFTG